MAVVSPMVAGFLEMNRPVPLPLLAETAFATRPGARRCDSRLGSGGDGRLIVGRHTQVGSRKVAGAALLVGLLLVLAQPPPTAFLATVVFTVIDLAVAVYIVSVHLVLQTLSRLELRGRVVRPCSLATVGLTSASGLFLGALAGGAVLLGELTRRPDPVGAAAAADTGRVG